MLLSDYAAKAATTAIFPTEHGPAYTALGLCSEVAELITLPGDASGSEVVAEMGDCLWYVAMVARTNALRLQWDLSARTGIGHPDQIFDDLGGTSGYVAGRIKKRLRDGHDSVPDADITTTLCTFLANLASLAAVFDTDLAAVAQSNLDKLASRAARGALSGSGDNR
ncbi:hypothetical protein [Pseudactinotalea sp. Z1748]|uniref:hypothetical protein n=1 Tax=Pseudactinotalea sp. Z1748 TaxID=3413027 RepID=UPI003C7D68DB